jgi:hypothetical protein
MNGFLLNCFKEILGIDDISESDVVVKREVYTKNSNRIDIFAETSNYCFFIENKVDAPLYNDLNDYLEYTKSIADSRGTEYFGIVLSKSKKERDGKIYYLSYNDLLDAIRKNVDSILFTSNNRYLMFFIEFIENISNVMEGKMDLNEDFYNQYIIHEEKIKNIYKNYNSLVAYRRDVVKGYVQKLNELNGKHGNIAKVFSREDYIVVIELPQFNDLVLEIDIVFLLNGVTLNIKDKNKKTENQNIIEGFIETNKDCFTFENGAFTGKEKYKLNQLEQFENKFFPVIETIIRLVQKPHGC